MSFPSVGVAQEIMGLNFLGERESAVHFDCQPGSVPEIPYTADELLDARETHLLVLVPPLSVKDVWNCHKQLFSARGYGSQLERVRGPFAIKNSFEAEWHLISKMTVKDSMNKPFAEQRVLLARNEIVPTAQVLVYAMIGHVLATGYPLFWGLYVRSSDSYPGCLISYRVTIGYGEKGLTIAEPFSPAVYDSCRYLGLAAARKPVLG